MESHLMNTGVPLPYPIPNMAFTQHNQGMTLQRTSPSGVQVTHGQIPQHEVSASPNLIAGSYTAGYMGSTQIPEHVSNRDLYQLMISTREEFRSSLHDIQTQVTVLSDSMANIHPRVEACEGRIATLEDNMDGRFREQESAISSLMGEQEEFPVDKSIICIGLKETAREDIHVVAQDLVESGLGLVNVQVERAKRLQSRNDKPGLVKIRLPTTADKISALRCKQNLKNTGYRRVYIRSSMSHTDRLIQLNFQTLLRDLPNGDQYRVTANGKLVKQDTATRMGAWSRGSPVHNPVEQRDSTSPHTQRPYVQEEASGTY